jgi:hypothetical protein
MRVRSLICCPFVGLLLCIQRSHVSVVFHVSIPKRCKGFVDHLVLSAGVLPAADRPAHREHGQCAYRGKRLRTTPINSVSLLRGAVGRSGGVRPVELTATLRTDGPTVTLNPCLLNPTDLIEVQCLLDGSHDLQVECRVVGLRPVGK